MTREVPAGTDAPATATCAVGLVICVGVTGVGLVTCVEVKGEGLDTCVGVKGDGLDTCAFGLDTCVALGSFVASGISVASGGAEVGAVGAYR